MTQTRLNHSHHIVNAFGLSPLLVSSAALDGLIFESQKVIQVRNLASLEFQQINDLSEVVSKDMSLGRNRSRVKKLVLVC